MTGSDCRESGSTTLRNLGFVAGGLLAIGFGIWRGVVADRQAKASQHQAETSRRGLLNERYQKGAEMLGSDVLAVRLGGIYELQLLAEDYPKQYHVQVMRLFCAFVRNPTKDEDDKTKLPGTEKELSAKDYQVREDVQEAMKAIGARSDADVELEKKAEFSPDLSGAYLPFVYLFKANLTDAVLEEAHFYPENLSDREISRSARLLMARADLSEADLTRAYLFGANLTSADLSGVTLTKASLLGANLTEAHLSRAKGLTQDQLGEAVADSEKPPNLNGARDADTGAPLEWNGGEHFEYS